MTIEIYEALVAANVPADKAKAVALAIEAAIERRCRMHESRMAGADGTAGFGTASSSGRLGRDDDPPPASRRA